MKLQAPQPCPVDALPYSRLYRHINSPHYVRQYFIIAGITTIVLSIVTLSSQINYGWGYAGFVALAAALVWFGFTACVFFAYGGLGYGASEERLLLAALAFLRTEKYDDDVLATIKARAEISSTVGPVRSLLPILLIPIVISLLNGLGAMPMLSWLVIALVLEMLVFPLALDTHTAHLDGMIRHAIAEYLCEQKENQRRGAQDQDLLFLQALLTAERRCSSEKPETCVSALTSFKYK